jgi:hypothetical protein
MHDLAATPTGAVKSAAAVAIEIMILPNIDLRIAQVRPRVEESVQCTPSLTRVPASAFEVAPNMLVVIWRAAKNGS